MREAKTYRAARRNAVRHMEQGIRLWPWAAEAQYRPVRPTGKVYRNKGKQEAARRLARMEAANV
jgi:hypothetical protein